MRNNVPVGDSGDLVPLAGVEQRAGGPTGRVLIEQLRASIRALEQVPVSLATPPAPGAAPSRPACSLPSTSPPLVHPSPRKGEGGDGRKPSPGGDPIGTLPAEPDPLPAHPPSKGRESPLAVLQQSGLHEIKPHAYRDTPAALGVALSVIERSLTHRRGLVLWCLTSQAAREWGRPYGPGLLRAGLDPSRFLIVEARNAEDAAWALEEGLKSGALIAALAQTDIKTPLAARRLGLAAQAARTPCLLLSGHGGAGAPGTLTRWRIATEGSAHVPFDASAPGAACWRLSLERCRSGAPGGQFRVESGQRACHEPDRVRVAAASPPRAAEAGGDGGRQHASAG